MASIVTPTLGKLQILLDELAEKYGKDVSVMVRKTGFTADHIRQVVAATAVERIEGTSTPPIGQFHVSEEDDIMKYEDMGKTVILIT